MQIKVEFYPVDIDFNNQGIIRVFGTTKKNEKICVYDDSLKPYFWVFDDNIEKVKKKIDNLDLENDEFKIISTKIYDKNYLGREVKAIKVEVNNIKALKNISEELRNLELDVKEDDINFAKRYLFDKEITILSLCEVQGEEINDQKYDICVQGEIKQKNNDFYDDLNAIVLDIEVYSSLGGIEKAKNDPILMIGLYGKNIKKILTWKKFKAPNYVEFLDSESEMIERFIELIKENKPDILIGYNSDSFDFPYIKTRADKYKIDLCLGLDNSNLKFTRGLETNAKINGIIHLDLLKFIKKNMAANLQLDSYSLDSVAKELLNEGKKEIDFEEAMEAWDKNQDIENFYEYNLHDVELTYKLFEKIFPVLSELVKLVGISVYDLSRISYGQLVENYLIKRAKEFNEIIPNKPEYNEISERRYETYQGAFVMEPKIGFYDEVVVFDFRALYASLIVSKNIYPGNLNNKNGYKTPEIIENEKKHVYYFDTKKEGFIPKVLKEIILRRNRIKELIKKENNATLKARSYALKTIGNSTYGMYGFFGARYYSKECASSITAFARQYIQDTIKKAEKDGFEVIYSDTDSIAISLKNKTRKDALSFMKKVNEELPSLMELELENFYKRGIFVGKKRDSSGAKKKYALIDDNNKLKIIGFETVRKDWSVIARETQLKVIELILKEGKHENALKHVRKIINEINNKKIELKKMIIKEQLKMPLESYKQIGPHVAVARKMKIKGYDVSPGASIYFIVSSEPGIIRDKAKIPNECKDYDSKYYIENQIIPSVEKIFEVFGINKDKLLNKEQKNLGEF